MKLTISLFFLLFSLGAIASPCGNKQSCFEKANLWPLSKQGNYYAKGTGSSCDQAFEEAKHRMSQDYDHLVCDHCGSGELVIRCGASNVRPFIDTCTVNKKTREYQVWAKCENVSPGYIPKDTRSRCHLVGKRIPCL